jgi:glyoxylase-like metal-dependent hydrolase (beta-lactamase superfamily II)
MGSDADRPDRYARAARPFYLEQLTASCWWIEVVSYQSLLVTGATQALLIDPLSGGRVSNLLAAARDATDLPIAAIAYTHHHYDHIGDASQALEALRSSGPVRVIATDACARAISSHGVAVPSPTEVLPADGKHFDFDGVTIDYGTLHGHCADNTWFLVRDEKVLQCVDIVHPGGLEFEAFGLAQDLTLYERDLQFLLGLDWERFIAGHAELGARADMELVLKYLRSLSAATDRALAESPERNFSRTDPAAQPLALQRRDKVVADTLTKISDQWSEWPEFEHFGWSHANAVYWQRAYFASP